MQTIIIYIVKQNLTHGPKKILGQAACCAGHVEGGLVGGCATT
jgi:hypothetical protein